MNVIQKFHSDFIMKFRELFLQEFWKLHRKEIKIVRRERYLRKYRRRGERMRRGK